MTDPAKTVDTVLFDVGNVLIEWDPRYLYRKLFTLPGGKPDEKRVGWFLSKVCNMDWNVEQDRGRSIQEANQILIQANPAYKALIEAYYGRFQEMIPGPIEGSVAALGALQAAGVPTYGLTNFGRETFPPTADRFPFLRSFKDVIVSGEEGLIKPDPAIFHLVVERFGIAPERTLFVDDSAANIATASELGFVCHRFEGVEGFRDTLSSLGLPTGA